LNSNGNQYRSEIIRVHKNKRIKTNKVFKDIATTGKSTMG
jgi:hypothetical protein